MFFFLFVCLWDGIERVMGRYLSDFRVETISFCLELTETKTMTVFFIFVFYICVIDDVFEIGLEQKRANERVQLRHKK